MKGRKSSQERAGWSRCAFLGWLLTAPLILQQGAEAAPPLVSIGMNFTGSSYMQESGVSPADANGAIGPGHFVEFINGNFSIYSRTNGTRVYLDAPEQFWESGGLDLRGHFAVDPRTIFDPVTQRWFASGLAINTTNRALSQIALGVSLNADPTAGWRAIWLPRPEGRTADFPTLGMNASTLFVAAYLSGTDGTRGTNSLVGISKGALMSSQAPAAALFPLLHGQAYGNILQPAVSTASINRHPIIAAEHLGWNQKPGSNVIAFHVDGKSILEPERVRVPVFERPDLADQPGQPDFLSVGDNGFSASVYEVEGTLYAVHSTRRDERSALRWYRIRSADFTLLESGEVYHSQLDYFFPSIAANKAGMIVIGFNASSSEQPIGSYAVAGSTMHGVTEFAVPVLLKQGTGAYRVFSPENGVIRWGDYSATSVDPTDEFRFWTIQLFTKEQDRWATQITEIMTALPELRIQLEGPNVRLTWQGAERAFRVERAQSLRVPTVWQNVPENVVRHRGLWSVLLPMSSAQAFYRLAPVQ